MQNTTKNFLVYFSSASNYFQKISKILVLIGSDLNNKTFVPRLNENFLRTSEKIHIQPRRRCLLILNDSFSMRLSYLRLNATSVVKKSMRSFGNLVSIISFFMFNSWCMRISDQSDSIFLYLIWNEVIRILTIDDEEACYSKSSTAR